MPQRATRDDVRRLIVAGAQLVDVMPAEEYLALHLAGAKNIPLEELGHRAGELDRARPVITYCYDFQ